VAGEHGQGMVADGVGEGPALGEGHPFTVRCALDKEGAA
jgi:hypothetical protein